MVKTIYLYIYKFIGFVCSCILLIEFSARLLFLKIFNKRGNE